MSSYVRLIPEYLVSLTSQKRFIRQPLIRQTGIRDASGARIATIIIASNRVKLAHGNIF